MKLPVRYCINESGQLGEILNVIFDASRMIFELHLLFMSGVSTTSELMN